MTSFKERLLNMVFGCLQRGLEVSDYFHIVGCLSGAHGKFIVPAPIMCIVTSASC